MTRRINLLPVAERARTTTDVGMLGLVGGMIIVIFALGFGYYLLHNTLGDREQELADVQRQTQVVTAQISSLAQYGQLATDRERAEALVQSVYAGRTLVADILDALSLVVPETVWFQSLSLTTADPAPAIGGGGAVTSEASDGTMSVEGMTYSFEEVAQLLVRLQLIPTLSNIDLGNAGSQEQSSGIKTFSIEAIVNRPADTETPLPIGQVEVEGL